MDSSALPIIDLRAFAFQGDAVGSVASQVRQACEDIGFFVITGHGVDPAVVSRLYDEARAFFDRTDAAKRAADLPAQVMGGLAFAPMLQEALAATQGMATPGDLKESINFGPRLEGRAWSPQEQSLREACDAYFSEMEDLARKLRRIFCAAIDLDADHFEPSFANHVSALRVVNYPAQTAEPLPGQLRAGAHTDYGFMTILRSEASSGGLQVQDRQGAWIDAPTIDNSFIVNIADAFMRWTNDTWVSTPHRVVNPPVSARGSARRQSMAYFVNPSNDALIECLEPFCASGRRPKYEPVIFKDYIDRKIQQAFSTPKA